MKRKILIWPNDKLNQVSAALTSEDVKREWFTQLVEDMFDTMHAAGGVGLAAIQIGEPVRVFVSSGFTVGTLNSPRGRVYVNPKITQLFGDPVSVDEGCLSLPGVTERALRYEELLLSFGDINTPLERAVVQLDGLEAQIAQHECEHLDGKIFIGTPGLAKRDAIKRKIQKALRVARK